jgi:transcriptional regulator with XRE-family HTH domain
MKRVILRMDERCKMSEKRTFLQIRAIHNLTLEALAQAAQVSIEDIYYLEAGVPYSVEFIEKVLQALSTLT